MRPPDPNRALRTRLPDLNKAGLIAAAVNHYNAHLVPGEASISRYSDGLFLERVVVNWLRHECTNYHALLVWVRDHPPAYAALRDEVFAAVTAAYPWLAHECNRQRRRKAEAAGA